MSHCSPVKDPTFDVWFCNHCMKPMDEGDVRDCDVPEPTAVKPDAPDKCPEPSLVARGFSLATAAVTFLFDGCSLSGVTVANKRLEICNTCDWFRDNECRQCGCYMPVKVYIAAMQCPLNPPKWGPAVKESGPS